MKRMLCVLMLVCFGAGAELNAGLSVVSITPLEANIPTQLGGYGARNGKPAEGIHDTLYAKCLIFEQGGKKSALITLDACSVPLGLIQDALSKSGIAQLTLENVMACASHSHTGLEGFAMDRRNVADNPHIGVFSEPMLNFVTERLAEGLRQADKALHPVIAGAGNVKIADMNRNRREDPFTDPDLTILRIDNADGSPFVVFANFTAHGTIVSEEDMLVSAEWAGQMQRTVEALSDGHVTCMYSNGAEGDSAPNGAKGASHWEMVEDYGRRMGIQVSRLAQQIKTKPVVKFGVDSIWVDLPKQQGAPDFVKIAGDEYHVTKEQLDALLPVMFPSKAPMYAFRVDDFKMVTFPGEPICKIGLAVKDAMRQAGIKYPCVAGLTTDHIGYILTADEYEQSGYEVTASFYGPTLGQLLQDKAMELAAGH
jgi:hypothetical protein